MLLKQGYIQAIDHLINKAYENLDEEEYQDFLQKLRKQVELRIKEVEA